MKPRERFPYDDPREWMNRAHSNLARSRLWTADVYLEDLCFDAQQAAEKAVKGLMLARGIRHPFIHDLAALLSLVEESGIGVPAEVFEAAILTRYAVVARYPTHTALPGASLMPRTSPRPAIARYGIGVPVRSGRSPRPEHQLHDLGDIELVRGEPDRHIAANRA